MAAWKGRFKSALANGRTDPRFLLETVPVPGYLPGASLHVASHSGYSGYPQAITRVGSSLTSGSLHIGDWSCTSGELSIGVRLGVDVKQKVPRGTLIRLMMGFGGFEQGYFEPVFLGQVQDVRRSGPGQWAIQARSMLAALTSRFTTTVDEVGLFYELAETELAEAYSVGEADIDLVSVAGLEKLTGGNYLIRITPDSGEPFFLEATGISTNTVTGCTPTAQLGTTAAAASSGNKVVLCAFLERNPIAAALTILTSTGTGNNGPHDLGPASWGLGLPWEHVDIGDCNITQDIVLPSGGSNWDIYSFEAQDNPAAWLQSVLQPAGLFLADRQGHLSVRCAPPTDDYSYGLNILTDSELIRIDRYSTWDPNNPAEYGAVRVRTATGGSTTSSANLETRPAIPRRIVDYPYIEENESAWRTQLTNRLTRWSTRVGEAFDLTVSGWRLATMAMGDPLELRTRQLDLRSKYPPNAMVLQVEPDWFGCTTKIRAVHIPDRDLFSG